MLSTIFTAAALEATDDGGCLANACHAACHAACHCECIFAFELVVKMIALGVVCNPEAKA